jgi:tRNA modification GTPase
MEIAGSSGETIAAVATPPGGGAVAVLRVSGPQALAVVDGATGGRCGRVPERRVSLVEVVDRDGEPIDDVLLTVFRAPRRYTGEDVVELSCHGGLLVTRTVLGRLLECGARSAEPGEFTRRAFLNGKMDLTQAEAVMDLISARTGMAMRAARVQMEGRLGAKTEALRAELLDLVAELEAYIDFPDEDIEPEVGRGMVARLASVVARLDALAATADHGRMLREGVRTVIFGEPNVGKSSLLNRLAGHARAIVHDRAGTTRDTIEESVEIGGVALVLTDTAGVRSAGDDVERQGVERSRRALENADLVIEVADASAPPGLRLGEADLAGRPRVLVLNKCDLGLHGAWSGADGVVVSCLTGEGFDALAERVMSALEFGPGDWGADAVAVNARHKACLRAASESAARARGLLEADDAPEFVAIELREALDQVGAIAGRVDIEEILGGIFGRFCIGK